jgi:hypothetical protein
MERQRGDLIHSARHQRATAQSLTIGGANSGSGGVHHVRSLFVRIKLRAREAEWFGRVSRGLRSLNGEAGAGEAAGSAVEGAAARLHPLPDRGGRGLGRGREQGHWKCGWRFIGGSRYLRARRSTVRSGTGSDRRIGFSSVVLCEQPVWHSLVGARHGPVDTQRD